MNKQKFLLAVLFPAVIFLSQGCTAIPGMVEPTNLPPTTELAPTATITPIPPSLTPVPPTPTPTREVISHDNIQDLSAIWGFPISNDSFRAVAFSPDDLKLAAGTGQNSESSDQKLRLLDVTTGQLLAVSEKVDAIIWDLAYSPANSFLAAALDSGIVQIRSPQDLSLIRQYYFPGPVNSLSLSPDGNRLAAGVADNGTGTVFIVNLTNGEILLRFKAHPYSVPDMAFSPDGSILATGAVDRMVKVWNSSTGELLHSLPQDGQGSAVAFSHDGGLLASSFCGKSVNYNCQEGGVILWSSTTWDAFRTLSGFGYWIDDLAFSHSDDLVAGVDRGGFLHFWQVTDGVVLDSVKISSYGTEAVAISHDGRYLSAGSAFNLSFLGIDR